MIFSDVSAPALDDCRTEVERISASNRSSFVCASATDLSALATGSVDVVVERAVLLFIEDRGRVFAEYHRVLRAGGRLSLAEPINSWMSIDRPGYLWGYDVTAVTDLERKIHDAEGAEGAADDDLLCGFDDRDLVAMARAAGSNASRYRPAFARATTRSQRCRCLPGHGSEPTCRDHPCAHERSAQPRGSRAIHRSPGARRCATDAVNAVTQ